MLGTSANPALQLTRVNRLQHFRVTLAGMFLVYGLCYLISIDSISMTREFYPAVSQIRLSVWADASIFIGTVIVLVALLGAFPWRTAHLWGATCMPSAAANTLPC